ncbi:hypothetical protein GQ600_434 [Phytophthora cactorum]|nr:hypothetical protein GQ600_434 [Phytophthora cactorum]
MGSYYTSLWKHFCTYQESHCHAKAQTQRERSDQERSTPAKVAKSTSVCEYCDREFTTRGISLHHKKCAKKQAHDKAAARKIRSYKFSILNEAVHEEILSFLSNQTLTKMQMITGDRYQQCEPELARYCCKCENDNPVIIAGLCRQCASTEYRWFRRVGRMDKRVILEKYGMPKKDFIFFRVRVTSSMTGLN